MHVQFNRLFIFLFFSSPGKVMGESEGKGREGVVGRKGRRKKGEEK